MCLSPNLLSDGTSTSCRKCWQCLEHRVDNWVGRCIAESKTCAVSVFITLTYGRDEHGNESHARAAILSYSDVQTYFKQLRNRGLKFRYLVVGEVGSAKGRTHWHVICFFKEALPAGFWDYGGNSWHRPRRKQPEFVPLVWFKRFNEPCWPHGFSQWETLHNGSAKGGVRYACKYINKDVDDPAAQSKLCMSKNPPIGAEYFELRAQKFVDEGIAPQDPFYTFPDEARRKGGEVIIFQLANKSSDLFCENFIRKWRGFPPIGYEGPPSVPRGWHYPESEYVQEYEDRICREEWDREAEALEERIRPARRWPFDPPMGYTDRDIVWAQHPDDPFGQGAPCVRTPEGPLFYGPNEEGKRAWRNVLPAKIEAKVAPRRDLPLRLTQFQWVEKLAPRYVFWMTSACSGWGRWKLAKVQPTEGAKVWLRSNVIWPKGV